MMQGGARVNTVFTRQSFLLHLVSGHRVRQYHSGTSRLGSDLNPLWLQVPLGRGNINHRLNWNHYRIEGFGKQILVGADPCQ